MACRRAFKRVSVTTTCANDVTAVHAPESSASPDAAPAAGVAVAFGAGFFMVMPTLGSHTKRATFLPEWASRRRLEFEELLEPEELLDAGAGAAVVVFDAVVVVVVVFVAMPMAPESGAATSAPVSKVKYNM